MSAAEWIDTIFVVAGGIATIYFGKQQNDIFREQNRIFAAQAGTPMPETSSKKSKLRLYWPALAAIVVVLAVGVTIGKLQLATSKPVGALAVSIPWTLALLCAFFITYLLGRRRNELPSKLTIYSANYRAIEGGGDEYQVGECLARLVAGDGLVFQIENHNFVADGKNYVPNDPKGFKDKRLEVEYSFGSGQKITIERPEHALLVLPEDTFLKEQAESLKGQLTARPHLDASRLLETIYTVSFDYLPFSPIDRGWTRAYTPDAVVEFATDQEIPGSLRMEIKGELAIDHIIPTHARFSDRLLFTKTGHSASQYG
jgi:hypothetical protein